MPKILTLNIKVPKEFTNYDKIHNILTTKEGVKVDVTLEWEE